jgi:hypothetical protein
MKILILACLLTPLVGMAQDSPAAGTVLLIDRVAKTAHVPVPQRGQTMATVESSFGEAEQQLGPVGDPPITRWVYPEFTVYFEGNRVIQSVVNKASATERRPD